MDLDPRTLAFYTVAIAAILAVLTMAQRQVHRTYPGFGWWVTSLVAFAGALGSIALRGRVPEPLVDFGPSWFGALSMLAVLFGQDRFFGRRAVAGPAALVALAVAVAMAWAALGGHVNARNALGASLVGSLALVAAVRFVVEPPAALRRAAYLCAAVLALIGVTRVWRAGFFLASDPGVDVLVGSWASTLNYTVNAVFATLWGFSFVLLNAARLEAELVESRDALERLAATDPLTGLRNRRAFFHEAEAELRRARRYRLPVALLMIDLDRFKQVNDRHGHLAGDELLRRVAETLARELRTTDIHARFGGEEFIALLVQTPAVDVAPTAERLRRAIAGLEVAALGATFGTTVSIGTAAVSDGDVELDELIRYADAALYKAKSGGRDRVELA